MNRKINSLQGLRIISFLAVFLFHSGILSCCAWAISVFFILSGFVMFYAYGDKTLECSICKNIRFAYEKIGKLYHLHIVMMVFALIYVVNSILSSFNIQTLLDNFVRVLLNVTLLQAWVPKENIFFSLNGVMWFLSVTLFLYSIFPSILSCIKRKYSVKFAIANSCLLYILQIIITIYVTYVYLPRGGSIEVANWITHICPLFRLPDFIIGCNLAYIYINYNDEKKTKVKTETSKCVLYSVFEIVTIVLLVFAIIIYDKQIGFLGTRPARHTILFTPLAITLIYLFAKKEGIITRFFTMPIFVYLGNISAYAYVIHHIVLRYVYTFFTKAHLVHNKWIHTIICLIITIALSILWMKLSDWWHNRKRETKKENSYG